MFKLVKLPCIPTAILDSCLCTFAEAYQKYSTKSESYYKPGVWLSVTCYCGFTDYNKQIISREWLDVKIWVIYMPSGQLYCVT